MKHIKTFKIFEKIELGYDVQSGISRFSKQFSPEFIDIITDICEGFDLDGRIEPMDRGLIDDYINSHSSYHIGGMRKGVLSIVIDGGDLSQMKSIVVDLDNVVKDWGFQIYIDIERYGNGGWLYDFMTTTEFIELETRFEVSTLTILIYKA